MCKNQIAAILRGFSLIWQFLALTSAIYLMLLPQMVIAEAGNNADIKKDKTKINTDFSEMGSIILVQQSAVFSQNSHETHKTKVVPAEKREESKRKMKVLATAYSSTVDQTDSSPFITASGTHVRDGVIAANFLKFGTKVKFPSLYGDKIFTVEDRMKSNYKVDLWFPTRQEAKRFGAKWIEMEIL